MEEDKDKNCSDYDVDSFDICDRHFIEDKLSQFYPNGFMPAWATGDMAKVTNIFFANSSSFSKHYEDIISGIEHSGKV